MYIGCYHFPPMISKKHKNNIYLIFIDVYMCSKTQTERLNLVYDNSSSWGAWETGIYCLVPFLPLLGADPECSFLVPYAFRAFLFFASTKFPVRSAFFSRQPNDGYIANSYIEFSLFFLPFPVLFSILFLLAPITHQFFY